MSDDSRGDPRLEIPEVLRGPVNVRSKPTSPDAGMWGMAKAWGIAIDFIFTIFAGAALGYGFDHWKNTAPTGLMIGLALGFVVAFIRIVRTTMKMDREESRKREEARKSGK